MDKNLLGILAVVGLAAGLIYAGQKPDAPAPEEEDDSLPGTSLDYEDEALKEALGKVEE